MYRRITEPFGKAGLIVAVVALVAAMVGGAYAADGGNVLATSSGRHHKKKKESGLNNKQKKQVRNISKSEAQKVGGKEGPQGPAGPQGAKGDTGEKGEGGTNGTDGTNGTNGTNGKSLTVSEIQPGTAGCEERGGAEIKQEGATLGVEVCNGEGSGGSGGGFPETLPEAPAEVGPEAPTPTPPVTGQETGTWSVALPDGAEGVETSAWTAIPFPVKLAASISGFEHVCYIQLAEQPGGSKTLNSCYGVTDLHYCAGTFEDPEAAAGTLCVMEAGAVGTFEGEVEGSALEPQAARPFRASKRGAGVTGALVGVKARHAEGVEVSGTFAVGGD